MAQTTKAKRLAAGRKKEQSIPRFDAHARARADKRALRERIKLEKEIVRLSGDLQRKIRRSDYLLLALGGALMARGARLQQAEAAEDLRRQAAIDARKTVEQMTDEGSIGTGPDHNA